MQPQQPNFHQQAQEMEQRFADAARRRPHDVPATVAFLAREYTFWDSFAGIVAECLRRPCLRPLIILKEGEYNGSLVQEHPVAALRAQGVRVVGENSYAVLEERPEVMLMHKPYELGTANYHAQRLSKHGIRPALVPYCTEPLGGPFFLDEYFCKTPCFWRTFAASSMSAELYVHRKNIPPWNVPVTGNPEYDRAVNQDAAISSRREEIVRQAQGRRVVLWTPHYSLTPPFQWSTWNTLGLGMARLFAWHKKDLLVVLRPHQLLRHLFIAWSAGENVGHEHAAIFQAIQKAGNICLDLRGTCLGPLLACDALISDVSSLLAKALRCGKSVLMTTRADSDGLGPAQPVADAWMHQTADIRGMERFLLTLLHGDDPLLPVPEAVLRDFCGQADGQASARIADILERELFPA